MITTIRITDLNPAHARLSIWVNHALICSPGGICLRVDEIQGFVDRLRPDRIECAAEMQDELAKSLDWENEKEVTVELPLGVTIHLKGDHAVEFCKQHNIDMSDPDNAGANITLGGRVAP